MKLKYKIIEELIIASKHLGLGNNDIKTVQDFLSNYEYGLAFDTLITQLYEYEIEINIDFYKSKGHLLIEFSRS